MKKLLGFTLIELLVSIAILAILVAVAVTFFGGAQKHARDAKRKSDLQALKTALHLYKRDNGSFMPWNPPTAAGCTSVYSGTGTGTIMLDQSHPTATSWAASIQNVKWGKDGTYCTSLNRAVKGLGYIKEIPIDPVFNTKDVNGESTEDYSVCITTSGFTLSAKLEGSTGTTCTPHDSTNCSLSGTRNYCITD